MLNYFERELIIKEAKAKELLSMFRAVVTRVANLKIKTLSVEVSAKFDVDQFSFAITVFNSTCSNATLTIYDFWDVKDSQKLVDSFFKAIKTDNFKTVKETPTR